MIDARLFFLLLTGLLLAILAVIAFTILRKNRKQTLEEPKYRMLKDD